ncbi:uncharacterized protein LOC132707106 [Cylas formicarius]|uniref:uncharacterized protein LOC132707106 n=1 Tax=Cylas formicarius TaxID=197179 RepID=UPI0029584276|nr:uncharacterized protein LOC132707106 [Cylas formicarius]
MYSRHRVYINCYSFRGRVYTGTFGLRSDPCCMRLPIANQKLFPRVKSFSSTSSTSCPLIIECLTSGLRNVICSSRTNLRSRIRAPEYSRSSCPLPLPIPEESSLSYNE